MDKLTAVAYFGGIPPNNTKEEKPQILEFFCQGVEKSGDIALRHKDLSIVPCDVALIQGFVHEHGKDAPHLRLRSDVINLQKKDKKRVLVVDSNLFLYANTKNPKKYLRYSYDGVFPTTGFYFDKNVDPTRWEKISKDIGISLKPYRASGSHILLCLQRNGGWSMQGLSSIQWMNQIIEKIRRHSPNRPIVVRTHPGDKKISKILKITHKNVSLSNSENLVDDLRNAWATVVFNSSPGVASLIEGVPTFVTDPCPQNSQCFGVANTDLSKIEAPILFDRQNWVEKISMCHWSFDELRSGEAWSFFKQYV